MQFFCQSKPTELTQPDVIDRPPINSWAFVWDNWIKRVGRKG